MLFQPLFAIDFWEAIVPVVTIILLVLSQVLGGKDKQEAKRKAEQQQQRRRVQEARQPQPGQPQGEDPVRQEIDEFLRRAGESDAQDEAQRREQQRRENQRRAEEERRRRQAANQPELQRRNYDPMAEGSAHYQRKQPRTAGGQVRKTPPRAPRTAAQPSSPEIVEAVIVEEVIESGKLSERQLKPSQRTRPEGVGAEFYETLDAENELRDAGGIEHSYDLSSDELGELDNPLAVGPGEGSGSGESKASSTKEIDFAAAVAGIFQDPIRAKEAIIAREILERPNVDRW